MGDRAEGVEVPLEPVFLVHFQLLRWQQLAPEEALRLDPGLVPPSTKAAWMLQLSG